MFDVWILFCAAAQGAFSFQVACCHIMAPWTHPQAKSHNTVRYRKCSISISLDFKKKCKDMTWNSAKHSERDRAVSAVSVSIKYNASLGTLSLEDGDARVSASWWSGSLSKMPLQDLYIWAGCSAEGGQTSFGKPLQCCGETFENWFNTWDFYSDRPCFDSLTLDSISTCTK